jgi:hypothetical protein
MSAYTKNFHYTVLWLEWTEIIWSNHIWRNFYETNGHLGHKNGYMWMNFRPHSLIVYEDNRKYTWYLDCQRVELASVYLVLLSLHVLHTYNACAPSESEGNCFLVSSQTLHCKDRQYSPALLVLMNVPIYSVSRQTYPLIPGFHFLMQYKQDREGRHTF